MTGSPGDDTRGSEPTEANEPSGGGPGDSGGRRRASSRSAGGNRRWLPVALIGLFVLLGIGGLVAFGPLGGERLNALLGSASGLTSTTTTAGTPTMDVKIGIGAPLTAGAVSLGRGMRRGVELAIDQANEREDVHAAGIRFVGVSGDDRDDPERGAAVAKELASRPDLVGVVGHLNSWVSVPVSSIYAQHKVVMISPASTDPALTRQGLTNVFRVCGTDAIQGPVLADFASRSLGLRRAYVVDDSTPYGEDIASAFAEQFSANGGTIVGSAKTSEQESDFGALAARIAGYGPDVICYGGGAEGGALLAKQIKDAGVRAPMMGGDGLYDRKFIERVGTASVEGDYCVTVGLPADRLPNGVDFRAAFAKRFPVAAIEAYDAYGYDAANVIIEAVMKEAKTNRESLTTPAGRDAVIRNVRATDLMGVTGRIAFDSKGDAVNSSAALHVVQGGAWLTETVLGAAADKP